jgi:hypothetical protein
VCPSLACYRTGDDAPRTCAVVEPEQLFRIQSVQHDHPASYVAPEQSVLGPSSEPTTTDGGPGVYQDERSAASETGPLSTGSGRRCHDGAIATRPVMRPSSAQSCTPQGARVRLTVGRRSGATACRVGVDDHRRKGRPHPDARRPRHLQRARISRFAVRDDWSAAESEDQGV